MEGTTWVYRHPEGTGLGQHHAPRNLGHVFAHPPEARAVMHAAVTSAGPHRTERPEIEALLVRTMADLDLADGTTVTCAGDDGQGRPVVEWADLHGNPRRTSVDPEFFATHFERA